MSPNFITFRRILPFLLQMYIGQYFKEGNGCVTLTRPVSSSYNFVTSKALATPNISVNVSVSVEASQCMRMRMMLTLGVGCADINQWGCYYRRRRWRWRSVWLELNSRTTCDILSQSRSSFLLFMFGYLRETEITSGTISKLWFEFFLNVFPEFSDKNICHQSKRVRTCNIFCLRDKDATTASARRMWETGSLNWSWFMLQRFIRFPEVAEFAGFLFNLGQTPLNNVGYDLSNCKFLPRLML